MSRIVAFIVKNIDMITSLHVSLVNSILHMLKIRKIGTNVKKQLGLEAGVNNGMCIMSARAIARMLTRATILGILCSIFVPFLKVFFCTWNFIN
jgi:hypothetical protein